MEHFARLLQRLAFALAVRPFLALATGLRVLNREGLPTAGPALIVANHNSHLDTLALMAAMPACALGLVRPVAAADHFSRGIAGFLARRLLRAILVERQGGAAAGALAPVVAALDRGEIVILFPEGSRGEAEVMAPFKRGIAHVVHRRPGVPVIPVHLHGMGKCLPRASALFVPFSCTAVVGAPADLHGVALADVPRRLQEAVVALAGATPGGGWIETEEGVPGSR